MELSSDEQWEGTDAKVVRPSKNDETSEKESDAESSVAEEESEEEDDGPKLQRILVILSNHRDVLEMLALLVASSWASPLLSCVIVLA